MLSADGICSLPCRCAFSKRAKVLLIGERINTVRFRVKPGREQEFLDAQKKEADWPGLRHVNMIKTGERYLLHHRRVVGHGCAR